jgi:hypothetical protein
MGTGRRLAVLLIALALLGIPAAALRAECAGASCRSNATAATPAPFCALPADLRALITAGTYEGRSPDALGVAGAQPLVSIVDYVSGRPIRVPWPSEATAEPAAMTAPLLFIGPDIRTSTLPSGVGLDQIAPTLEPILGFRRPHPEVRNGQAIPDITEPGVATPLVVLIVWKGVGTRDVDRLGAPWLRSWSSDHGDGRQRPGDAHGLASAGSLPLDPIAVESTIGTGALPAQHGITGTWLRGERGKVTLAFGRGAPPPVVAALGDDLDRFTNGRAKIGLIQDAPGDVGLTGDAWYGAGQVRDRTLSAGADLPAQVASFLTEGWGADATPDLLAVPLSRAVVGDDRATDQIVDEILAKVPDATIVVAGTGSLRADGAAGPPSDPEGIVPTPGGAPAGGFFVDREPDSTTTAQDVVDEMRGQRNGYEPVYADAFADYAVRFGRYC